MKIARKSWYAMLHTGFQSFLLLEYSFLLKKEKKSTHFVGAAEFLDVRFSTSSFLDFCNLLREKRRIKGNTIRESAKNGIHKFSYIIL